MFLKLIKLLRKNLNNGNENIIDIILEYKYQFELVEINAVRKSNRNLLKDIIKYRTEIHRLDKQILYLTKKK